MFYTYCDKKFEAFFEWLLIADISMIWPFKIREKLPRSLKSLFDDSCGGRAQDINVYVYDK